MTFKHQGTRQFRNASVERVMDILIDWDYKGACSLEVQSSTPFHCPKKSWDEDITICVFPFKPCHLSLMGSWLCTGLFVRATHLLFLASSVQKVASNFLNINWNILLIKLKRWKSKAWRDEPEMKVYLVIRSISTIVLSFYPIPLAILVW